MQATLIQPAAPAAPSLAAARLVRAIQRAERDGRWHLRRGNAAAARRAAENAETYRRALESLHGIEG